ncbi:hypothetical protein RI367_006154 [Sorochytrium milnesiophthora]
MLSQTLLAAQRRLSTVSPLLLALVFLLQTLVSALPMPGQDDPSNGNALPTPNDAKNAVLSAGSIVAGVIFIVVGLLFTFWGARLLKVVIFLTGAWIFAAIAWGVLAAIEPAGGWTHGTAIFWGVTIVAALLGGALLTCLYKVGVFAVGALGGFTLAVWILSLSNGGLISGSLGQKIFMAVLAVLGGIAMVMAERPVTRIATSIAGSYGVFFGIDMFARTGFSNAALGFVGHPSLAQAYTFHGAVIGMVVGFVVLALIGMFVQFKITGPHVNNKSIRD